MAETLFQEVLIKNYILPFLLVFAIVFGILEKTKLLGDSQKQLNAIISAVIASIFVGVLYPKEVVSSMILFLTVALVIVFVFLLLYGFVSGGKDGFEIAKPVKIALIIIISIATIIAVIWATGVKVEALNFLFGQPWSKTLWSNIIFVIVISSALALVLKGVKK